MPLSSKSCAPRSAHAVPPSCARCRRGRASAPRPTAAPPPLCSVRAVSRCAEADERRLLRNRLCAQQCGELKWRMGRGGSTCACGGGSSPSHHVQGGEGWAPAKTLQTVHGHTSAVLRHAQMTQGTLPGLHITPAPAPCPTPAWPSTPPPPRLPASAPTAPTPIGV